MDNFHEIIEATIPCLRHHGGAWANCTLIYCLECGKDIVRDCERDTPAGECDTCNKEYDLADRTARCGECGNCNNCCTHEGEKMSSADSRD